VKAFAVVAGGKDQVAEAEAKDALPKWVQGVEAKLEGNVMVAATLSIQTGAPPPSNFVTFDKWGNGTVSGPAPLAIELYKSALQQGQQNREKIKKVLREKYGKPSDAAGTEWALPGLHVKYEAGDMSDTVRIELASVRQAGADEAHKAEAAEPKL
jgi:hypothetical protein